MAKKIPAGYYDDGQGRKRYWDGTMWTDQYEGAADGETPAAVADPNLMWSAKGKPLSGIGGGRYRLTKEMLTFEKGTLSLKAQQILTHEIFDVDVTQTLGQKARGLGTVSLYAVGATGREQVLLEDIPDFRAAAAKINEVATWARAQQFQRQQTTRVEHIGMQPVLAPAAAVSTSVDLNAEIAKLAAFRDQGILDADEFTAAKKQLLGL